MCDLWLNDFSVFRDWSLKNGYEDNLTIDRIDNDGNYDPSNCRWVTMKIQANNKSNNRHLTAEGETKTIAEWADVTGLDPKTIYSRVYNGHADHLCILPIKEFREKTPKGIRK